jgi:hypothetical protein
MTLARITNYVDGNVLTGAQLNNEFDNILNNGPSLVNAAIPGVSIVQGLTGAISTAGIGAFAANGYQLKSTTTIATLTATSSYSINTQTAGPIANGRDQAAVFASTDVHFYAITTGGTSTTAAGICSSVGPPTGPTLPPGYSAWAYLASCKYTTASSAPTNPWRVSGSLIGAPTRIQIAPTFASTEVAISLSSAVPSIAMKLIVQPSYTVIGTASGAYFGAAIGIGVESSPAGGGYDYTAAFEGVVSTAGSLNLTYSLSQISFPTAGVPILYSKIAVSPGSSALGTIRLMGYLVPNGDVG